MPPMNSFPSSESTSFFFFFASLFCVFSLREAQNGKTLCFWFFVCKRCRLGLDLGTMEERREVWIREEKREKGELKNNIC